jgi:hypothetical protein
MYAFMKKVENDVEVLGFVQESSSRMEELLDEQLTLEIERFREVLGYDDDAMEDVEFKNGYVQNLPCVHVVDCNSDEIVIYYFEEAKDLS